MNNPLKVIMQILYEKKIKRKENYKAKAKAGEVTLLQFKLM